MFHHPALKITGNYVALLVSGAVWVFAAGLDDTLARTAAVAGLAVVFAAAFLLMLILHLRSWFDDRDNTVREALFAGLTLSIAIGTTAAVYSRLGIIDASQPDRNVTHDYTTALYFSIVTFTTLGYGDFRPVGVARAVACVQALTGYFVLALIASSAADLVRSMGQKRAEQRDDGSSR